MLTDWHLVFITLCYNKLTADINSLKNLQHFSVDSMVRMMRWNEKEQAHRAEEQGYVRDNEGQQLVIHEARLRDLQRRAEDSKEWRVWTPGACPYGRSHTGRLLKK